MTLYAAVAIYFSTAVLLFAAVVAYLWAVGR
jgi:hypothetical protein